MQDSDYEHPDEHSDSEMYVLPAEETGDDSYEPPPAEQETRTVHPALPFTRGDYIGEAAPPPPTLGAQPARHGGGGSSRAGRTLSASHPGHPHVGHLLTHKPGSPRWNACLGEGDRYPFPSFQG